MDLSYADLVRRLYDLERLAEPPIPGERSGSLSSYDRSSRYDAETDTYLDWDANADGSGSIRTEDEWIVAFESEGPGVIWRVWSALPGAGHVQVFIDDDPEPVVDQPFGDFFGRFGEDFFPMNFPDLSPTLSRGRNRFLPIPFNRSCKVRLAPDWGHYYHFTYTTFSEGTRLPTFDATFDREAYTTLSDADRRLSQRGWTLPRTDGDTLDRITVTVPPGATVPVHSLAGNRAITGLRVASDPDAAPFDGVVLRELALQISWDGESDPSVWAPLGDLFGTVAGLNYHRALPQGVTDSGLYSHWFMPFAERAEIEITNDGTESRTLTFAICHRPLERSAQDLLRFHAKWHGDAFLERSRERGRAIDWPLLLVEGQGRFCGVSLHVWNTWDPPVPVLDKAWWTQQWRETSTSWWWGEGDEKFFVDGEKFPSTFGTGSEDYVGFAWAAEPPFPTFDSAYACLPRISGDAYGHTSVSRFHVCDDVPFQTAFEGYIEKYNGNTWGEGGQNVCEYSVVAYWYQRPGGHDPYRSVPLSERRIQGIEAPTAPR